MSLLYGLHDRAASLEVPNGGWCVDTIALSENPTPLIYDPHVNWIVRANWGYGLTGTIPLPAEYQKFADACASYIFHSQNANIVIIGNEPNHENERPSGVYITPAQYVDCFIKCRDAIKRAKPQSQVLPAPCAPYHADPTNWLDYWREMLNLIAANGGCDGIPFHAYTRSSNPADITNPAKMGPPLETQYSGFLTYQDALDAVPLKLGHLPAYGTEFCEILPKGWDDANTGVVQAAYAEIDEWNRSEGRLPIQCLILYRWPKYDKWFIEGKRGVIEDFRAAVGKGYTSPIMGATTMPNTTFIPSVSTGTQSPVQPPRDIDQRLIVRGVHFEFVTPPAGTWYWRMTKAQWLDKAASQVGPDHHILGRVLREGKEAAGVPLAVNWSNGAAKVVSKRDDPNALFNYDYAMSASLNEYSIQVSDGAPSDKVTGIGMGKDGNSKEHTSTWLTFEFVQAEQQSQPQPPAPTPEPVPEPTPTPQPTPMPAGIIDPRVAQAILNIESGGRAFGADGKPLIRFENHIFKSRLGNDALYDKYFRNGSPQWTSHQVRGTETGAWLSVHDSQSSEWTAFTMAHSLNPDAAYNSISMGAPQIMGFNHARVGFPTAQAMYEAFKSEPVQAIAFINYFLSDPALLAAMHNKDWRALANGYNGSGNVDSYSRLLKDAYDALGAA